MPDRLERPSPITRRRFGTMASGLLAPIAFGGACGLQGAQDAGSARLRARPVAGTKTTASGRARLGLDPNRDAILHVPARVASSPLPLLVLFHGAGGSGERQLGRIVTAVDAAGVVVLAPDSRGSSWDAIRRGFGPDVAFIDRALARVFETVNVDPARIAVGGFSDGATYALSLGLTNGDLFRRIVAFSPGFVVNAPPQGKPRIFVSHGIADEILPIDRCSRVLVPALKSRGYDVAYREFAGGHEAPPAIADEGLKFVAAT